MKVLVTGGSGLIGSYVVKQLVEQGHDVFCVVRSRAPHSVFYERHLDKITHLIYADILDEQRMFELLPRYDVEAVIHLAAQPLVGAAQILPLETIKTNVMGAANILEACRRYDRIKAVLVASSDKAYGSSPVPYKEEYCLRGDFPYEASKSAADLISQAYAKTYDLPVAIARLGNVFGPGDLNFSRIMPGIMRAIIMDQPLEIRTDGKLVREYLFVEDAARAYLLLLQKIEKAKGEAFNFTSGWRFSVLDLVKKVSATLYKDVEVKVLNTSKYELKEQYLDDTKARQMLGWKPTVAWEDAVAQTYAWYKKFLSTTDN